MVLMCFFVPYEASCHDDQIKLVEDNTEQNGRVEICFNQQWNTLDYSRWSSSVAKVACIELGFPSKLTMHVQTTHMVKI